jgi:hypothetical protein
MSQLKFSVIVFIVGILVVMGGALLKILHFQGGDFLIGTGIMVQGISLFLMIVALVRKR